MAPNNTTVFDDHAVDRLLGLRGRDWFLSNEESPFSDRTDQRSFEEDDDIDPPLTSTP